MVNTSQAPDLEGIHHEMYGITEQIRVMNKINTRLVQHLTTNNSPPATAPVQEEANRSRLSHRSSDHDSQSHQALVEHIQPEVGNTNYQVCTPGE